MSYPKPTDLEREMADDLITYVRAGYIDVFVFQFLWHKLGMMIAANVILKQQIPKKKAEGK
jgi:hypothetical protein